MSLQVLTRDTASAAFFDAAAQDELLIKQCSSCRTMLAPSITRCVRCRSTELVWTSSLGKGKLVSWAAPHAKVEGGTSAISAVAIVELDEGPWLYVHVDAELIPLLEDAPKVAVGFDAVD